MNQPPINSWEAEHYNADDVYALGKHIAALDRGVPDVVLPVAERRRLGGKVTMDRRQITDSVISGLERAPPALFAPLRIDTDAFAGRMRRGLALRGLAHGLRKIAQRAEDLAILDESSAVEDGMRFLRSAMVPDRRPGSDDDRRRLYLRAAVLLWDRQKARMRALGQKTAQKTRAIIAGSGQKPRTS